MALIGGPGLPPVVPNAQPPARPFPTPIPLPQNGPAPRQFPSPVVFPQRPPQPVSPGPLAALLHQHGHNVGPTPFGFRPPQSPAEAVGQNLAHQVILGMLQHVHGGIPQPTSGPYSY